jgi:glycosyltransferase involved in cell wall biosynthesis
MAGSDAGKLWDHPQFEPLYDEVLRAALAVLTGGQARRKAIAKGLLPARVTFDGGFSLSDRLFSPDGPKLDVSQLAKDAKGDKEFGETVWGGQLSGKPCIGLDGKLGPKKGSLELLRAIAKLRASGRELNLLVMAHGRGAFQQRFRELASELGIADCVMQIPFLPHWRVPEFLRACEAVCCLEQDFPIAMHTPIVAREILLCGGRLIASTEMLGKLGASGPVHDNWQCVAISDVTNDGTLANGIARLLDFPQPDEQQRDWGRNTAQAIQAEIDFPITLEEILTSVAISAE